MTTSHDAQPPAILNDRYRLLEQIGQGSMALIYRAEDITLGRDVAIKFLAPNRVLGEDASARFLREARTIARLAHPHIMALYDVDRDGPWHYLVLEHIAGQDLQDSIVARGGPFPVGEAVTIIRSVLAALGYAHAQGVIHRDIKPANIMLTADGVPKLTDFGLALTREDVRLTQEGMILGTLLYMAPEVLAGREADHRTDLYAVGVILYELVTGRVPYSGDSMMAIASQIINAPLTPPRDLNQRVPSALEEVITRLLAKDPAQRYASAEEALDDLPDLAPPAPARDSAPDLQLFTAQEDKAVALERERHRFADQLETHIVQALELLLSQINAYQVALRDPQSQMAFSVLTSLIRQALQQTHDLKANLHPTVLDALGLEPALDALAEQIRRTHGLQVTLAVARLPERLSPQRELALLRLTQDAFDRSIHHARAAQVAIQLEARETEIVYRYTDNGALTTGTERLHSARERIGQLGGGMRMGVNTDGSFELVIHFPLQQPVTLTPRELDVLQLVAEGLINKEIAAALGISPRTVNFHLDNVFSKLGVNSRTEAAIHALREGWIAMPEHTAQ